MASAEAEPFALSAEPLPVMVAESPAPAAPSGRPQARPDPLQRFRQLQTLAAQGPLSVFESVELADLDALFGQLVLPLPLGSPSTMKTTAKRKPAITASPASDTPPGDSEKPPGPATGDSARPAPDPLPEGVDQIIAAHKIVRSPWNRKHFPEASLAEMEGSIREHGVLQRPTVRPIQPGEWFVEDVTRHEKDGPIHGFHCISQAWVKHLNSRKPGAPAHPIWSTFVPEFFPTKEAAEAAMPTHELVFGERRWRGASRIARDYPLPVTVRPLSDRQALELQKIENLQREDLDPIEEGRGLRQMIDEFGYTLEDLIARLQRSKSHIYGRIKLGNLCDAGADLLHQGTISESVAIRIARLPTAAMQAECVEEIADSWAVKQEGATFSDSQAADLIEENFVRELKGSPFDQKDAELVPVQFDVGRVSHAPKERVAGGACTDCPLRSGNAPDYTPKSGRADMCLNPACYRAKQDAHFARVQVGQPETIVSAEKAFNKWGQVNDRSFTPAHHTCYDAKPLPGKKKKTGEQSPTYGELAAHLQIPAKLAQNPKTGEIETLIDVPAITAAAKKAGLLDKSSGGSDDWRAKQKREQEKAKREQAIRTAQVGAVVAAIEQGGKVACSSLVAGLVKLFAAKLSADADADVCRLVARRRGLDVEKHKGKYDDGIRKSVEVLGRDAKLPSDAFALVAELLTARKPYCGYGGEVSDPLVKFAELVEVDLDAIREAGEDKRPFAQLAPVSPSMGGRVLLLDHAKAGQLVCKDPFDVKGTYAPITFDKSGLPDLKPTKAAFVLSEYARLKLDAPANVKDRCPRDIKDAIAKVLRAEAKGDKAELTPKGKASKPAKAGKPKRGAIAERIKAELLAAGPAGLKVKDLADKLKLPARNLTVYFATSGKKVPEIRKVAPACFKWAEGKGGAK